MSEKVFAVRGENHAIDGAELINGEWISYWSRKTLDQLRAEYPTVELLDVAEFIASVEARLTTDPVEISAERYDEMLNVLPPVSWTRSRSIESFKISERLSGRITAIFVKLGDRYFTFNDVISKPHAECIAKVEAWLKATTH